MLLPFVTAPTLTKIAHCDAGGRGVHANNKADGAFRRAKNRRQPDGPTVAPFCSYYGLPGRDHFCMATRQPVGQGEGGGNEDRAQSDAH